MGWVVNTIIKILLNGICSLFKAIASDFITDFGINIGAKFPKVGDKASMSLSAVLDSYNTDHSSVFDTIFPMESFKTLFVGLALVIATALLVKELILAMSTPMLGQRQHPLTSALKYVGSMVGIVLSYRIFIVAEYVMNEFYIKFGQAAIGVMNSQAGVDNALDLIVGDSPAASAGSGVLETGLLMSNFINPEVALAEGIGELILNVLIVWLLLTGFLKLILEILERYIVLGALFYTSPLAFSTLPSNDTRDIFKSWTRMSISEMILIIMNSICIAVFLGGLANLSKISTNAVEGSELLINNRFSWMIYMLLLIAWLQFSQKLDSFMNSLGLSTAQTGGSLGASVLAGVGAAMGVGRAVGSGIRGTDTFRAMKNASVGQKGRAGLGAAKDTLKKVPGQVNNALGGRIKSDDSRVMSEAEAAMARAQNRTDSQSLGQSFNKAGDRDTGTAFAQQREMTGSDAHEKATKLAQMSGDKKLQDSVASAKADSFKFAKDSNGIYGLSYQDKKGNDVGLQIGGDLSSARSAGAIGGVKFGVSGSDSAMQTFDGNGSMRQAVNGETLNKAGMVGGTAIDGAGNTVHAIRNTATGETRQVFAPGSTNIPAGAKSIDGGYYVGGENLNGFSSYNRSDNLAAEQTKFYSAMDRGTYYELAKTMSSGNIKAFAPHMDQLIDALHPKDPLFAKLMEVNEAAGGKCSWDKENNTLTIDTPDEGQHKIEFFNPDAVGRNIDNGSGVHMAYTLTSTGKHNEALNSAAMACDVAGLKRDLGGLARAWDLLGQNNGDGSSVDYIMPKENKGTVPGATWFVADDGIEVVEATRAELVAGGCFGDDWRISGDGAFAYRLTDAGKARYAELTGMTQSYQDIMDQIDSNMYE